MSSTILRFGGLRGGSSSSPPLTLLAGCSVSSQTQPPRPFRSGWCEASAGGTLFAAIGGRLRKTALSDQGGKRVQKKPEPNERTQLCLPQRSLKTLPKDKPAWFINDRVAGVGQQRQHEWSLSWTQAGSARAEQYKAAMETRHR